MNCSTPEKGMVTTLQEKSGQYFCLIPCRPFLEDSTEGIINICAGPTKLAGISSQTRLHYYLFWPWQLFMGCVGLLLCASYQAVMWLRKKQDMFYFVRGNMLYKPIIHFGLTFVDS